MVRAILDWSDEKTEALRKEGTKEALAKTAGLGLLEGFINTCAFFGAYGFVLTVVDKLINLKK